MVGGGDPQAGTKRPMPPSANLHDFDFDRRKQRFLIMATLKRAINKTRLEQLRALQCIIADAIDAGPGARDLAGLTKQYRETLKEIAELKGGTEENDEIDQIISTREADGKPGAVRQNRTRL